MKLDYFKSLVEQMEKVGIEDYSNITIQAIEGYPAIIMETNESCIKIFVQDSELTQLECKCQFDI